MVIYFLRASIAQVLSNEHNRVLARIDNYEENAYAVYGHSHNVRSLRTQMERFRDDYIAKKSSFSISIGGVDFRF